MLEYEHHIDRDRDSVRAIFIKGCHMFKYF